MTSEVLQKCPRDERILNARYLPQPHAAAVADLDVDREYALESFHPGQRPSPRSLASSTAARAFAPHPLAIFGPADS